MTQRKTHQGTTYRNDIDEEMVVKMAASKHALGYQAKQALVERLRPQYRDASRAQKTAVLDAFVKLTAVLQKENGSREKREQENQI